jgi:hypothetical protein
LSILVLTENGRERTDAEYRELLAAGGFALTTVIQTDAALNIIESVPA